MRATAMTPRKNPARKFARQAARDRLREEFLVPLKLTPYAVAAALNVPRTRRRARAEIKKIASYEAA